MTRTSIPVDGTVLRAAVAALLLLAASGAFAAGAPSVSAGWIRWLPGAGPLAGYFELRNNSAGPIVLRAARSPAFGRIMLHRTVVKNGQASMQPVTGGITVAPGATVSFAPGGYHLMLMQRRSKLAIDERVPVTLVFDDGDELTIQFRVQPPGTQ